MIDTILFDLVGVLLFPKANYVHNPLVDEIDHQVGAVTNDIVFKERVLRKYSLTDDGFDDILRSIVEKYEPFLPLWRKLPEIRKRYKLGIINNGTYLTFPQFEGKYHISQQFNVFISSAIEGVCKPDRTIYLRACESLNTKPQNCLFMDDGEENIIGAERVGMETIHWLSRVEGFQEFINYIHVIE